MMKRYVRAAQSGYESQFGEIISIAGNRGYDFKVSDNLKIMLTAKKDVDIMPTITVETIDDGGLTYSFLCKLEFPTIEQDENDDPDAIAAILDKWQKLGDLITAIQEKTIDAGEIVEPE